MINMQSSKFKSYVFLYTLPIIICHVYQKNKNKKIKNHRMLCVCLILFFFSLWTLVIFYKESHIDTRWIVISGTQSRTKKWDKRFIFVNSSYCRIQIICTLFCVPLYVLPSTTCHVFILFHFKLWLFYKKS